MPSVELVARSNTKKAKNLFDTIIRSGIVVDGTGAPAIQADVGLYAGKITAVGDLSREKATEIINATGYCVTPGFIDIHRHADAALFRPGFGQAELRQGLTTIVNGNCGLSIVPCPDERRGELLKFLSPVVGTLPPEVRIDTMAHYLEDVSRRPLPLNVGMLVGDGTVRTAVNGYGDGSLSPEQIEAARSCLREALAAGAFGISLGIVYAPEYNYHLQDFLQVLTPAREYGVPLTTHIRGEGDTFLESIAEVVSIAEGLGVQLEVSHFKCMGKRNWEWKDKKALQLLENAQSKGISVGCDVYPYTAGSTQLIQILPPEYLEGGLEETTKKLSDPKVRQRLEELFAQPSDRFENLVNLVGWENIYLSTLNQPENQAYVGKSVMEAAQMRRQSPCACACDLLVSEQCRISMVDFMACEEDVARNLQSPLSCVISDSIYPNSGRLHPRVYGTFAHVLAEYVRRKKALTLEQAVWKMSGKPASVLLLTGKGQIAPGYDGDLLLFDPQKVTVPTDYSHPEQYPTGFERILIGGKTVLQSDRVLRWDCGRVLRRK